MAIREKLAANRFLGISVGVVMIGAAAVAIVAQTRSGDPATIRQSENAFYTDDDGQTWFTDSLYKFPPFDHNGKPAVRAFVYSTMSGKKFVAVLRRYKPDSLAKAKETADKVQQGALPKSAMNTVGGGPTAQEQKLPGANQQWVPYNGMSSLPIKSPEPGPCDVVTP